MTLVLGWLFVSCVAPAVSCAADAPADERADAQTPSLAVLDIEILGDLGDARLAAGHEARRRKASVRLREELRQSGLYHVVDESAQREMIDMLSAVQYLHKCNGCELDIAKALDAELVLVAWVHRVSNLVLSLNYRIHDADTGQPVVAGAFDFRGDNDAAWNRAVIYLVEDLQSRRAKR